MPEIRKIRSRTPSQSQAEAAQLQAAPQQGVHPAKLLRRKRTRTNPTIAARTANAEELKMQEKYTESSNARRASLRFGPRAHCSIKRDLTKSKSLFKISLVGRGLKFSTRHHLLRALD